VEWAAQWQSNEGIKDESKSFEEVVHTSGEEHKHEK
jgi:hypothetical protein